MKKASVNIVETLAADAIGKLPDRNAAEAVQRMQGVSIERDMGKVVLYRLEVRLYSGVHRP